jgi:hypothetical protein
MLPVAAVEAISVVIMMHVMWEHSTGCRKDFEGKKARTRAGFARVMLKERPGYFTRGDEYAAMRLRIAYRTDRNPPL